MKPHPETDTSDPYVELKIYVEKSVINAFGGLDPAKLVEYWAFVDEAQPDDDGKNGEEINPFTSFASIVF